jgi:O-antigen/teichoic acid export membrane protein
MPNKTLQQIRLTPSVIFKNDQLHNNLAKQTVRGGMTTVTAQGILFVITLIRTAVLARLLTPEDFGLIGMVAIVIGFAAMFKDAGLSLATVQKDHITSDQISTLFWVNGLISGVLCLGVLALAPFVSSFYHRPELTAVTAVLSVSLILEGLTIQHAALLRRHMKFIALTITQIFSAIIGMAVAISLAWYGWRYWALVGGTIASSCAILMLTFFFCPWVPGKIKKTPGVCDMLTFGGHITGFNFFNYFSRNADNILIGKFISADALGLYAKAYSLVQLPIINLRGPITQVAVPACSRIHKNSERIRAYARKYTFLLAFFSMPLMVICFLLSNELVLTILGDQWLAITPLLKIFAFVGFIQAPANIKGMMLLSCGKAKEYMYQGIAVSAINIIAFLIGLNWGVFGVASAYAIAAYLIQPPTFWYTCKQTPLEANDFLITISRPAAVSIALGIVFFYVDTHYHLPHAGLKLIIISITYIGLFLCLFIIIPGGLLILKQNFFAVFRKGFLSN